jgi:3-oxoacyl-[acyl-carrier-protein] synthase-3
MTTLTAFTYQDVENVKLQLPKSSFGQFQQICDQCFDDFLVDNAFMDKIVDGTVTMTNFHHLLDVIFHQVYISGSTSLAMAGCMTDPNQFKIREFLFHHAEEEQDHWKWIVQDLRNTGYTGKDPRECHPPFVTEAYRSFAMYYAMRYPVESIAICYILEGLSSKFGVEYGSRVARTLNLDKDQMSFFLLHGELDQGHETEILDVLKEANLSPEQWATAVHAAKCTTHFYKEMYNYAASL